MDIKNLLWYTLASMVPSIIYMFIIYLTSPYGTIKLKNSFNYLTGGVYAVSFLSIILYFIDWNTNGSSSFYDNFFVIAPREELSKYLSFLVITFFTGTFLNKKEHPVGIMVYFGIVGLGFAVIENVFYCISFGQEVLLLRTFTSTISHMLFGLLFGYWVALSKIDCSKFSDRSVFGVITHRYKKFKVFIYTIIGYISSVIYHGLWNYNIDVSEEAYPVIIILMLFFGVLATKFMMKDLNQTYRRSLK